MSEEIKLRDFGGHCIGTFFTFKDTHSTNLDFRVQACEYVKVLDYIRK